jgi:hypothetical protein
MNLNDMTDSDLLNEQQPQKPTKRPPSLTILCVLSFIWKVISCIYVLDIILLIQGSLGELIKLYEKEEPVPGFADKLKLLSNLHWSYPCLFFITILVSFWGVIKMWKLQKKGFHIYTLATIAELTIANLYKAGNGMPDIIISGFFVALYAMQLRYMVKE